MKEKNCSRIVLYSFILFVWILVICCCGCADGYPEKVEGIDFGGAEVLILDYWSGDGARVDNPTEEQQAIYAYRDWINETYNVNLHQRQGGDWGTCAEEMISFTNNPDGSYRIYIIEPGKVGSLVSRGYAAAIPTTLIDTGSGNWNSAEIAHMTIGGKTYGLYKGHSDPRGCLYFNKRVLEEAGIDWNNIYNLQREGKWTWAAFEDLLNIITRDTDGDGITDIYGILGSADDMYVCAVYSNGGCFFDFDESGRIFPAMGSEATIEALSWSQNIHQNYWAPTPEGANWDWYKDAWKQGYCGFYMYQTYGGFNDNSEMADMTDSWGCVAFPVPNEGDTYITVVSDNITMIPACYNEETIAKLAFLYDLWSNPPPGYEDDSSWIGNKYNYTDENAVDETYAMLREPEHCRVNSVTYLGTQNDVLGTSLLWLMGGSTPAELIEAGMPAWQALCDDLNESFIVLHCEHEFGEAVHYNDNEHYRICTLCGFRSYESHSYDDHWSMEDNLNHSRVCNSCGYTQLENHIHDCENENVCIKCGAQDVQFSETIQHSIDYNTWYSNDSEHYHICTKCNLSFDTEEHYSLCNMENHSICSICNAESIDSEYRIVHTGISVTTFDEQGHWTVCSVCNNTISDMAEHQFGKWLYYSKELHKKSV